MKKPIFIILLISLSFLSYIPFYSASGDWVSDDYVYFQAQPEVLTAPGYVTFTLVSKVYTGDIDLIWGFNGSFAQPSNPQRWVSNSWVPLGLSPQILSFDKFGADTWYLFKNVPVVAGKVYIVRIWVDIEFKGLERVSGKYNFGMKRSSDTVQEAIANNRFYLLDPWYDSSWKYAKKLTFNNSASAENLVNFPVSVKLTSSNFDFTDAQSDGDDLLFVDSDNTTILDHEVEDHNSTAQETHIWVEIPQIDAGSTTDHIWLYYGNSGASSGEDVEGTWNSDYVMIQHLIDNSTSTTLDSTSNDNDGTKKGANEPIEDDGYIYKAQKFDGNDDKITIPDSSELEIVNATSFIIYPIEVTGTHNIIRGSDDRALYIYGSKIQWYSNSAWTNLYAVSVDTWYFCHWVLNGTHGMLYINGSLENTVGVTVTWDVSEAEIGSDQWNQGLNGTLDETRLLNNTRSADWVEAQYLSITDDFITFGSETYYNFLLTVHDTEGIAISGATVRVYNNESLAVNGTTDTSGFFNEQLTARDFTFFVNNDGYIQHEGSFTISDSYAEVVVLEEATYGWNILTIFGGLLAAFTVAIGLKRR